MKDDNTESALMNRLMELEKRRVEFTATVNHNLKTPLNGIIGFSSVLLAEANNLEPEQRHQLRLVYDSARQLLDRIDTLLVLQRMESGKIHPCHDWFAPGDMLSELAANSADAAKRNGIELVTNLESCPNKLFSDMNLIRRAIQEFLDNSIRFGSKGTCTLGMAIESQHQKNSYLVKFTVTNQGAVAKERKEKLITSLNSSMGYLNTSFDGLGLGLALARQVAIILDGHIEPDLDDDKTTFSMVLQFDDKEIETA